MPTEQSLAEASHLLSSLRRERENPNASAEPERKLARTAAKHAQALKILAQEKKDFWSQPELLRMAESLGVLDSNITSYAIERNLVRVQVFQNLIDAIDLAIPLFNETNSPEETWHDTAFALLFAFRRTMSSRDPEREYGYSKGGPAVRFVQAGLLLLTGNNQLEDTIAKALIRKHQDYGTGSADHFVSGQND